MFLFLCLILIINFLLRQKNLHSYKWEGEKKITIIYAWYSCPLCPVLEMICNGKNMTCVLYMKFNLSVPILIFINLHVLLSSTSPLLIENQVNSECPFFFFLIRTLLLGLNFDLEFLIKAGWALVVSWQQLMLILLIIPFWQAFEWPVPLLDGLYQFVGSPCSTWMLKNSIVTSPTSVRSAFCYCRSDLEVKQKKNKYY